MIKQTLIRFKHDAGYGDGEDLINHINVKLGGSGKRSSIRETEIASTDVCRLN